MTPCLPKQPVITHWIPWEGPLQLPTYQPEFTSTTYLLTYLRSYLPCQNHQSLTTNLPTARELLAGLPQDLKPWRALFKRCNISVCCKLDPTYTITSAGRFPCCVFCLSPRTQLVKQMTNTKIVWAECNLHIYLHQVFPSSYDHLDCRDALKWR